MYTIKAKYLGSGIFEYNNKLDFFFTLAYVKLKPDTEYFLLIDDNKNVNEYVEVDT